VAPAILAAWEKLSDKPDVLMIPAHGIAHPRGCGLASHIGLWLDLPCIGVAKRLLYGYHTEVGSQVGEWSEILDEHDSTCLIGAIVRTRGSSKPIYVSPGHLIDLKSSVELVLACSRGFRLPAPLRTAQHAAANIE
jgi:deoxyribonuclease V